MQFLGAVIIVTVAVLTGILFYHILKVKGPWGSLWTFILTLGVAGLAAATWVNPVGPVYRDLAWVPVFFVILLFALFLAAATPAIRQRDPETEYPELGNGKDNNPEGALTVFFWLFIVIMLFVALWGAMM